MCQFAFYLNIKMTIYKMRRKLFFFVLAAVLLGFAQTTEAQKVYSKSAYVTFYSSTPIEKIDAQSSSGNCVIDLETGKVEFAVLVKSLKFKKALMEEHFNENYMDSHRHPKASFKGQIEDHEQIDITNDYVGTHRVTGSITIKGVSKDMVADVNFVTQGGSFTAATQFELTVADFDIKIPPLVRDNVAKTVEVQVKADLLKL